MSQTLIILGLSLCCLYPYDVSCSLIFVVLHLIQTSVLKHASKQLELCRIASEKMRRNLTANLFKFLTILIPYGKCAVL